MISVEDFNWKKKLLIKKYILINGNRKRKLPEKQIIETYLNNKSLTKIYKEFSVDSRKVKEILFNGWKYLVMQIKDGVMVIDLI